VRNTLVRVVSAEWGWLDRCGGPPRGSKLDAKDFGSPESLLRMSSTVEQSMRSLLSKLDDDGARRVVEFSFPGSGSQRKTVGHLLWHAANHAAHHRGQVAMLLRIIGHTPENFDVLFFEDSRPASAGQ
jgi:Uncharacterized protein conserved in bacteria